MSKGLRIFEPDFKIIYFSAFWTILRWTATSRAESSTRPCTASARAISTGPFRSPDFCQSSTSRNKKVDLQLGLMFNEWSIFLKFMFLRPLWFAQSWRVLTLFPPRTFRVASFLLAVSDFFWLLCFLTNHLSNWWD